jgi:uncharacterized protein
MCLKFIAFALAVSAQAVSSSAQPVIQAVPERPRIIVDGYGEVKTLPDIATINYTARGEGSTSDDAVRAMVAMEARIERALRSLDRTAEPRTGDVRVTPVKSSDCKENDDNTPQLSVGSCSVVGYVATQSLTLRTTAVKGAGTMVGLVGRGGGFDAKITSFDLRDPQIAQRQATAAALSDAASKASAIAAASRLQLGAILSINTSSRENGPVTVVSADELAAPPMQMEPPPPVPVKLTPEPITTSANLSVTYAIGH